MLKSLEEAKLRESTTINNVAALLHHYSLL